MGGAVSFPWTPPATSAIFPGERIGRCSWCWLPHVAVSPHPAASTFVLGVYLTPLTSRVNLVFSSPRSQRHFSTRVSFPGLSLSLINFQRQKTNKTLSPVETRKNWWNTSWLALPQYPTPPFFFSNLEFLKVEITFFSSNEKSVNKYIDTGLKWTK